MSRRIRVQLRKFDQLSSHRIVVNVLPSHLEFLAITDAVIRISTLSDGKLRAQLMREASLDKSHNTLKR
jgi:hypothetical protein